MGRLRLVDSFSGVVVNAETEDELREALARACHDMGFDYFALVQHVDADPGDTGTRIHNYPADWVRYFEEKRFGRSDPIHRASHRALMGFTWEAVSHIVPLTRKDEAHLEKARNHGLGNGYTVPANIPGETSGSCSFAVAPGAALPEDKLIVAQLIGGLAFESVRRLAGNRLSAIHQRLTDRQRDCVLWAARGKTDWEISRILGISHETVIQHLKFARERYGVQKRTSLVVRALFDGLFSFSEIVSFNHR